MKTTKVFIVCSGLGHIKRGYESFNQECFKVLSTDSSLDITLFKGGGEAKKKEIPLWNLPRNSKAAIEFSKAIKKQPYWVEQFSFFISLLPHLQLAKPDVIYISDINLANFIRLWRDKTNQSYKLLFCNGGPVLPKYHFRWDRVQQVSPPYLNDALDLGVPNGKQILLPYAVHIGSKFPTLTSSEKSILRHQLKLPEQQPLILSVGAISKSRKRMDYVIREIANLPKPRPFLLLLGQKETDSSEIVELGNKLLGAENFEVRTVAKDEVANYYKIADLFVLASLGEGFGLVYVEAMSYGLPCLAHDYGVARYVLGEMGYFANLNLPGSLTRLVSKALEETCDLDKSYLRYQSVYNRFSWDRLKLEYINLLTTCAKL